MKTRNGTPRRIHVALSPALPPLFLSTVAMCGGHTSIGGGDASTAVSGSGASTLASTDATPDSKAGMTVEAGQSTGASNACGPCEIQCGDRCVNTSADRDHCGSCGVTCGGDTPYCSNGACTAVPCALEAGACGAGGTCCGNGCCDSTQLCCQGQSGGGPYSYCAAPSAPTAPAVCGTTCCMCRSDRNLKRDIRPIDPDDILRAIARLPVSEWSYKSDPGVRHMGPMAQDFHQAFGLGGSDRSYDPIDAHGVAFAAIQALYERVEAQQRQIDALERDRVVSGSSSR
jgi:hypothetical protein